MNEFDFFSQQFSLEEFELMRPSIDDRHRKVVRDMKMFMETQGRCNNCTKWMMETVESRKKGDVSRLDVGFWTRLVAATPAPVGDPAGGRRS